MFTNEVGQLRPTGSLHLMLVRRSMWGPSSRLPVLSLVLLCSVSSVSRLCRTLDLGTVSVMVKFRLCRVPVLLFPKLSVLEMLCLGCMCWP